MTNLVKLDELEREYGRGSNWQSEDVQEDIRNLAVSVYLKALRGEQIPRVQYDAATTVLNRAVWKTEAPKHLSLVITPEKLAEAQKKAKLLPES